jgi:ABC-type branched-subunit amino acid transport system permease subunit
MRRIDTVVALAAPMLLIVVVGIGASLVSRANQIHFLNALAAVAIVVAIYVFVGSTGVLSFGQISFVALGAFAAGVMTVPLDSKVGVLPDLYPLLRDHTVSSATSTGARGGGRWRLRVPGRPPSDAALRAGGGHRDVRRA